MLQDSPNASDAKGQTPLHLASAAGHVETCALLLAHSAEDLEDAKGVTASRIAADFGALTPRFGTR